MKKMNRGVASVLTASVFAALCAAGASADGESGLQTYIAGWGEATYSYAESFDEEKLNSSARDSAVICEQWEVTSGGLGLNDSFDSVIKKAKDGYYLSMGPFTQLVSLRRLTGRYLFELDCRAPDNQFAGIFFRSSGEAFNSTQGAIPYFEDDKSGTENLGIGSTGIYLLPRGSKLMVIIKTAASSSPSDVSIAYTDVETGINFTNDFRKISIADSGEQARIYVDEAHVCTVEYSDRKRLDDKSEFEMYAGATVRGADGEVLLSVDSARICAEFSTVALAVRINDISVDNLSIKEYSQTQLTQIKSVVLKDFPRYEYLTGDALDLTGALLEVTDVDMIRTDVPVSEEMVSGFDSSSLGRKTLTIEYGGTTLTHDVYVVESLGSVTEPPIQPPQTEAESETGAAGVPGGKNNSWIFVIVAVAAVLAAAVLTVVVLRKKK